MQRIQNYVKAAAAFLIFFFVYDFFHRTDNVQVVNPGDHVVIGGSGVTHTSPSGTSHVYVPPEGHVTVVVTTKPVVGVPVVHGSTPAVTSVTTYIVQDKGWCKVPGIALVYSDTLLIQLDIKFAYYKRFSATAGLNRQFVNVGVYRHVDDLIGLRNLEVGITGGVGWNGVQRVGISARLNL